MLEAAGRNGRLCCLMQPTQGVGTGVLDTFTTGDYTAKCGDSITLSRVRLSRKPREGPEKKPR